jgi:E3 ubiquitin-protein ligase NEDD4
VREQFKAFETGLFEMVPREQLGVFDEAELEFLIGGLSEIDVDDWARNTEYRKYTPEHQTIKFFWAWVRTLENEKKSRLLQFATGTSRIPVNGFKDLQGSDGPRKFTIEFAGSPDALPKSHTW